MCANFTKIEHNRWFWWKRLLTSRRFYPSRLVDCLLYGREQHFCFREFSPLCDKLFFPQILQSGETSINSRNKLVAEFCYKVRHTMGYFKTTKWVSKLILHQVFGFTQKQKEDGYHLSQRIELMIEEDIITSGTKQKNYKSVLTCE